jgi:hypothetical protein
MAWAVLFVALPYMELSGCTVEVAVVHASMFMYIHVMLWC